jgi:hypothetical protein
MSERGKRAWMIYAQEFATDTEFRDAVAAELAGLENIGHRLGGGFVVAPVRERHGDDYVTVAWRFEHVFMPAARRQEPELVPEPQEEPERVEVEPEPVEA